jgi:hypothetical protein
MSSAEQPESSTERITIIRNSPEDTQTRQIVVYLDGESHGELMYGDSVTLSVAPGPHTIRVDNTWNQQELKLEIRTGEQLKFLTKSVAGKFSWFLLGFLGFGPINVSIEPAAQIPKA